MNKRKIILSIGLISSITALCGGVFAAYSIDDEAEKKGFRIQIANVEFIDVVFKDYQGNDYVRRSIASGSTLGEVPDDPELSGYTFAGWTTDTSTYNKTSDDLETKTYTVSTTYYPRFASYGYKTSTGDATHLNNKWETDNNISLSSGDKITLGTYIRGKASLEDATSQVTISNGGEFALVCGENEGTAHDSAWNKTYASDLDHWFIQKYITLTPNSNWTNHAMIGHFYAAGKVDSDRLFQTNGTTKYLYYPYDYTNVTYAAIYQDSTHQDYIEEGWSNVQYKSADITIDNRTNVVVPDKAFSLWKPSDSTNYRIKFTLPSWNQVYRPRVHYWYNDGKSDVAYTNYDVLKVFNATSNMTQLSGSTYYIDIDAGLPLAGMIIFFDQSESGNKVKFSNDIPVTALNGAGNYTINGGYTSWDGDKFAGATLTKDA